MNTISKNIMVNKTVDFNGYSEDGNRKQARKTGILCIGCAIIAGLLPVGAVLLKIFPSPVLKLYFLFLFLSAALGLFGFQEVFCNQSKKLNLIMSMISLVILIVLLLISFGISFDSGSETASLFIQFAILYGILSTVIPIFLTISALLSNNTEKWKLLTPLAIPVIFILCSTMANSKSSKVVFLLLPIGWGLLGIVSCLGNAAPNSNEESGNMDLISYE